MFKQLDERMKNLTVLDIGLTKLTVFFMTIALAKLFPQLLGINLKILIILVIACAIKPMIDFWVKK